MQAKRYIVISPVRDEERYVEATLQSMVAQTYPPAVWMIVDDGSRDGTVAIIEQYQQRFPFIRLVRSTGSHPRQPGGGVIRAFNRGVNELENESFDFIVKLDCDLRFGRDYFQGLLSRFESNPRLGIASGVYFEQTTTGQWTEVRFPAYHAAGACKFIRKECWEEIGGFIASRGWDTVDEIRAIHKGWTTGHFRELRMEHLKPEGSGIGQVRTNVMLGEIYYLTGGSRLFFFLKLLRRLTSRPPLLASGAMLWGYLRAGLRRQPLLVTAEEARQYRSLLHKRMRSSLRFALPLY